MSLTYKVILQGAKPGQAMDRIAGELATLFKLPLDQARALLTKPGLVIKRGVDLQTAQKYQSALEQRGCLCTVQPESAALHTSPPVESPPSAGSDNRPVSAARNDAGSTADHVTSSVTVSHRNVDREDTNANHQHPANNAGNRKTNAWLVTGIATSVLVVGVGAIFILYRAPSTSAGPSSNDRSRSTLVTAGDDTKKSTASQANLSFSAHKVSMFEGPYKMPEDPKVASDMSGKPTLAGRYSVLMTGCGGGCRSYSIVDLKTGNEVAEPAELNEMLHADEPSIEMFWAKDSNLLAWQNKVAPYTEQSCLRAYGVVDDGKIQLLTKAALSPCLMGASGYLQLAQQLDQEVVAKDSAAALPQVSAASIAGNWSCRTQNPNGTTGIDGFRFNRDGTFVLDSGGFTMYGIYQVVGDTVAMNVTEIPALASRGVSTKTSKSVKGEHLILDAATLKMDLLSWTGARRSTACTRTAAQSQTAGNTTSGTEQSAAPPQRSVPDGRSAAGGSRTIRAGSTFCLSPDSFRKVQAIEMSGNPYVALPADCSQLDVSAPVAVVQYVGDLALVRNSGGAVYVQQRDLQ